MIDCRVYEPPAGWYFPRRLGGVPRIGDYIEGKTSWDAEGVSKGFRIVSVTHVSAADGWNPAIEVEVEE